MKSPLYICSLVYAQSTVSSTMTALSCCPWHHIFYWTLPISDRTINWSPTCMSARIIFTIFSICPNLRCAALSCTVYGYLKHVATNLMPACLLSVMLSVTPAISYTIGCIQFWLERACQPWETCDFLFFLFFWIPATYECNEK